MAVMGLIATYEALRRRRMDRLKRRYPQNLPMRLVRWITMGIIATAMTTVIASTFTGLPAAYHFNRIAPLGVIANVLALPIVSLVVMPMAMLAVLAMPFGFEEWPLWAMGQGLRLITDIAGWVAGLPHANLAVATLPGISAWCLGFAAVWLCLWTGRLRLLSIVPVIAAILLSVSTERPDILIDRTGKNVAIRNDAGQLALAQSRRAKYAAQKWLLHDGDGAKPADAAQRPGWICSKHRCLAKLGARTVIYLKQGASVPAQCAGADILISEFPLRGACAEVRISIDRFDLWRHGAQAIFLGSGDPQIVTAADRRGRRPWTIKPIARRNIRLAFERQY